MFISMEISISYHRTHDTLPPHHSHPRRSHNHQFKLHTYPLAQLPLHLPVSYLFCYSAFFASFFITFRLNLSGARFNWAALKLKYAFLDSLVTLEWAERFNLSHECFEEGLAACWLEVWVAKLFCDQVCTEFEILHVLELHVVEVGHCQQ